MAKLNIDATNQDAITLSNVLERHEPLDAMSGSARTVMISTESAARWYAVSFTFVTSQDAAGDPLRGRKIVAVKAYSAAELLAVQTVACPRCGATMQVRFAHLNCSAEEL